jgi:hypothetical protein
VFVNPAEMRLRAGWRLLVATLVFLAVLAAVEVLLVLVGADLAVPDGGVADPWRFLVFVAPAAVATAVTVIVAARRLDHRPLPDFGLRLDRSWWRDVAAGLVIGAVPMMAVFAVQVALGWVSVRDTILSAPAGRALSALVGASLLMVVIGVYEEILVRGYLLTTLAQGLRRPLGARGALVTAWCLSSLAFGALHAGNPAASATSTVNVAVAGLFLGLGYLLTGRLALSIGAHVSWNLVQGPVLGLPVSGNPTTEITVVAVQRSGPDLWTGGAFGPEAGLLGLLAMALGSALVIWWVRRNDGGVAVAQHLASPPRPSGLASPAGTEGTNPKYFAPSSSLGVADADEYQGPHDHEPRLRSG